MGDASSLLFSPHVVSSSLLGTPSGGPFWAPKRPKTSLLRPQRGAKWLKSNKKQRIFNIFMVPTFRRFWMLRTSKMHFREPSGARSGNVPSPLGPSWRAFRFSAPPPRGPQDASGRQFDVPKHPRSLPKRPPRIPRYPKSAKVQFWDSK